MPNDEIIALTPSELDSEMRSVFTAAIKGVTLHLCTRNPTVQPYFFVEDDGKWVCSQVPHAAK